MGIDVNIRVWGGAGQGVHTAGGFLSRLAVAAGAEVPTLFVRGGLRPSGVAPSETLTRFTWTLASQHVDAPR